jgi:hypothetical protein
MCYVSDMVKFHFDPCRPSWGYIPDEYPDRFNCNAHCLNDYIYWSATARTCSYGTSGYKLKKKWNGSELGRIIMSDNATFLSEHPVDIAVSDSIKALCFPNRSERSLQFESFRLEWSEMKWKQFRHPRHIFRRKIMEYRSHKFLPIIAASILIFSCSPKSPQNPGPYKPYEYKASKGNAIISRDTDDKEKTVAEVANLSIEPFKLDSSGFEDFKPDLKPVLAEAHKKYLSDPMKFKNFPDQDLPEGPTAVVGSRVCVLYPNAELDSSADLQKLPAGILIPFGTIIPIKGEKVSNPEEKDRYGMFQFQENWNWFYRSSYKGKEGLVFGADLYGINDSNEDNRVSARLYQTKGKYDVFYPVVGYFQLPSLISERLQSDKLAFQAVSTDEYSLNGGHNDLMPDDMIALYAKHTSRYASSIQGWSRKTPLFVTTDLVSHAQHLMFDRTLQYLEEAAFLPRLKALTTDFLADLEARKTEATKYQESLDRAILYFQVAQALLDLAPDRIAYTVGSYGGLFYEYSETDEEKILSAFPQEVRDEIAKMDKADGIENSSVFAFKDGTVLQEDYSQYKPRGHYASNGALSAYFRAMMWFGRINFLIARSGEDPFVLNGGKSSDSAELTFAMEPIVLLVTDTVKRDSKLYKAWCDLFDPITALIGLSDDLSFKDLLPLWRQEGVSEKEFGSWASDKQKLLAFMEKAHEELHPPAISGNSVFYSPSEGKDKKPPMGWKLFGQRFTYDSYIQQLVSSPRLKGRDMVRGLDIMKALGSNTANDLLLTSDYSKTPELKTILDALSMEFDSYAVEFWQQNYYNDVLFQIRAQARFEPGTGLYFTESPAWGKKALISAHGTWSELRHDTLLYTKMNYSERAGDGDFEPTFRTEKIPEPIHYIEPNLPFWQGSAIAIQKFLKTLDAYDLLDEESMKAFGRLQEICAKGAEISESELKDLPVSPKDVEWIATIPAELVHLVLVHVEGGEVNDPDQLRMAIIADVFTNPESGLALESGVGIPYRIYVPLNDGQGGKRIAIGYSFSYYEFVQPMNDRMTDESWRSIVYGLNADLSRYLPFWAKNIALPPEPAKPKE